MAEHQFITAPSLWNYQKRCRCQECKDIHSAYQKIYRAKHPPPPRPKAQRDAARERFKLRHPEKLGEYRRKHNAIKGNEAKRVDRQNNPAKYRAKDHRYYEDNKTVMLEKKREWRRTPHGRAVVMIVHSRTRARRQGAQGAATPEQVTARWEIFGNLCYLCKKPATATDHVIPIARGGTNWPANLRPICKPCNCRKHARTLTEYILFVGPVPPLYA